MQWKHHIGFNLLLKAKVMLAAIACFVAYAISGHTGIYGSQRIAVPNPVEIRQHLTLSKLRNAQNRFVQWLKERRH